MNTILEAIDHLLDLLLGVSWRRPAVIPVRCSTPGSALQPVPARADRSWHCDAIR